MRSVIRSFTHPPLTPQGMSEVGLVGPRDIGSSLLPNATATWLIEADSGKMVPHFVEVKAANH